MWYVLWKSFRLEKMKKRDRSDDLGIDGRII
jgi:hypothetical protein